MRKIDVDWIDSTSVESIRSILKEYRFLVRRFVPWLASIVANSDDEKIRQLLMPNLIDESGSVDGRPSHLQLLDNCLQSCGIENPAKYTPSADTIEIENWFFGVFSNEGTYESLAVIGPGTESISSSFLLPLESKIQKLFPDSADLSYFYEHREDVEADHAQMILDALTHFESISTEPIESLLAKRKAWEARAIDHHQRFWDNLRTAIQISEKD